MAVDVPFAVGKQLETIRRGGLYNMLDRTAIQYEAAERGYWDLAAWIEDHRAEYGSLIFEGMTVDGRIPDWDAEYADTELEGR